MMTPDGTVLQAGDGRGFVIEVERARFVVTAAHCLAELPPPLAGAAPHERTIGDFLGPLGGKRNVAGECVFVDPIADLAVFGEPDNQELVEEAEAFCDLIDSAKPFVLGKLRFRRPRHRFPDGLKFSGPPEATSEAMMLSLEGEWFSCRIGSRATGPIAIKDAAQPIRPGMSGSPIVLPNGSAVGVVCVGAWVGEFVLNGAYSDGPAANPLLLANLPAWLLR